MPRAPPVWVRFPQRPPECKQRGRQNALVPLRSGPVCWRGISLAGTRPANLPPSPGTQRAARRAAPDLPRGRALLHRQHAKCRRGCLRHEALSSIGVAPTRGQALPSDITGCGKSRNIIPATGPLQCFHQASSRFNRPLKKTFRSTFVYYML